MGHYGTILRTTNGGTNWISQSSGTTDDLISVSFTDSDNGTAVGGIYWMMLGGTILRTTNGGSDWISQLSPSVYTLYGVSFTDFDNGTAVGDFGTILRTTDGGVSFVEESVIDEIPTNFNLTQNYPNPFNPSTKIRYSVPQASTIVIRVFDVLGNEIETLMNEEKAIGTYEISWYAEQLPSGIYFYRLQAGPFVETKKMVLIK